MAISEAIAEILTSPAAYADGRIYPAYRWLREHDPFALVQRKGFQHFRVVTRHSDIMEISRQNALFRNAPQPTLYSDKRINHSRQLNGGGDEPVVKSLIHMNGPEHLRYRLLTQAWFQPKNIKKLDGAIRALASAAVDKMAALGGRCDFVKEPFTILSTSS